MMLRAVTVNASAWRLLLLLHEHFVFEISKRKKSVWIDFAHFRDLINYFARRKK